MSIDFDAVDAGLLARADTLIPEWFPQGKRRGHEWVVGSLQGEPGDSLSINLKTGVWKDFAEGTGGKGLVSLYAKAHGMRNGEAARELGGERINGHHPAVTPMVRLPKPERAAALDAPLQRPPADAPVPGRHRSHGEPTALYCYADADGVLGYVARYDLAPTADDPEPRKQFAPWIWTADGWRSKAFPKPRPLYGLDRLAAAPGDAAVLLVEGEKCVDAGAAIVAPQVLMTWPGGAKAVDTVDWSPLKGRTVNLWPDNDAPGRECMARVAEKLIALGCSGRIIQPTGETDGWDLADAVADTWDRADLKRWLSAPGRVVRYPSPPAVDAPTAPPSDSVEPSPSLASLPAAPSRLDVTRMDKRQRWEVMGLETRENNGTPPANEDTVLRILAYNPPLFWFDDFLQRPMTARDGVPRPLTDSDYTAYLAYIQRDLQLHKMTLGKVQAAVDLYAMSQRRNCSQEWLSSLTWDGVSRLDSWLPRTFGTPVDAYHMAVGRCFLLSIVARVMRPGCQVDTMPVFEGGQGVGKSTVCRILGGEWFTEATESPLSKDFVQCMRGKMLVEVAELDPFTRAGQEKVKAIISNRIDTYRPPYGRTAQDFPRMCVMVGTTNRTDWVKDDTGARRFWRVVVSAIETGYVREHREQLFAEAVARYREGASWWDVPVEAARQHIDGARADDAWHAPVMSYCNARQAIGVRIEEVLTEGVGCKMEQIGSVDSARVRAILTIEGWRAIPKWHGGRTERRWCPGAQSARPAVPQVDTERTDGDAFSEWEREAAR